MGKRVIKGLVYALAALLLLWGIGWLALPPLLKSQAQQRLTELLGRQVSIGKVDFSPWSLSLAVHDLRIAAAPGADAGAGEPQFEFKRLFVNAELRSLLRLAPVVQAVQIDAPQLRLKRLADGRYDVDDIIKRLTPSKPAPPEGKPQRFALYNLELRDGEVTLQDDPVQRRHELRALQIGLPFLSNLPSDVEVTVKPQVAFALNGTAFDSGAETTPFAPDRETALTLRMAEFDLAPWLPYLPQALPVKPQRGKVSADLKLNFALAADGSANLVLRGQTQAQDVALHDAAGAPLLGWKSLQVALDDVQPLARSVALGTVRVEGARLDVQRDAAGAINLLKLAPAGNPPAPAANANAAAAPWKLSVARIELADGLVDWRDAATSPPARLQLGAIEASVDKLQYPQMAPMPLRLKTTLTAPDAAMQTNPATIGIDGEASDRSARLRLQVGDLDLRLFAPYAAQALTPAVEGRAAAQAQLQWAADPAQLKLMLGDVRFDDLKLSEAQPFRRAAKAQANEPPAALKSIELKDTTVDLTQRQLQIGSLRVNQPMLEVARRRDGQWNLLSWLVAGDSKSPSPESTVKDRPDAAPWSVALGDFQLDGGRVRFIDELPSAKRKGDEPVRLEARALRVNVKELAWPGGAKSAPAAVQVSSRIYSAATAQRELASGLLDWRGQLAPQPLMARGRLKVDRFPVHALEPYFGDAVNLSLLRAEAGYDGDFSARQSAGGLSASANGNALLGDLRLNARDDGRPGDELMSWQSFSLRGIKAAMAPGGKPSVEIAQATLSDFYSRLVVTEQGRLNLQDVAVKGDEPAAPASAAAASAPAAAASEPAAQVKAAGVDLPLDLSVADTQLINGRIDFSDRFVRPNYSAALTELNGKLGAFSSKNRDMATLELKGRAASTALLEIGGSLNPTANPLALDIKAKATELELAPLSPYAGKYAGYAIERGKLSMDVAYRIDPDGRLEARNQVIVNQLTFGERIESPQATKLPVLLAVALLKDRNGVIDLDLPISGSLNDPQFSIFGLVLKVLGNLLVKAVTAPFALLSGGGGEEMNQVQFTPGTSTLSAAGRDVIDKVAKALTDRSQLKMTVTGTSDPVGEVPAIQAAMLDARITAEQRNDALRSGTPSNAELPALADDERTQLVKRIYGDTKLPNKPRNAIGLSKDIPVAEMQALLKAAMPVTTDTARELALQRGLAVRDALVAKGLASERLFLAAPKLRAAGDDEANWTPRAQLALSTQ